MSINFGIQPDFLQLFNDNNFDQLKDVNKKKMYRTMKNAVQNLSKYQWDGPLLSREGLDYYPSVQLFGQPLIEGSEVISDLDHFHPAFIANVGSKTLDDTRVHITYKLGSDPDQCGVVIYMDDDVQHYDISAYVSMCLQQSYDRFYIAISKFGHLPHSIAFSRAEFTEIQDEEEEMSSSTLLEYVQANPSSDSSTVYLRNHNRIASVHLVPTNYTPVLKSYVFRPATLGMITGGWVFCDYSFYSFSIFLTDWQYASYPVADWVMLTLASIIRSKYLVTGMTIAEYEDFSARSDVVTIHNATCTAIEACHVGDTWTCHPVDTYKNFDARVAGRFYADHTLQTLESYLAAYTWTPYLNKEKCRHKAHHLYPCGICPSYRKGKMKSYHLDRKRAVKKFNYGIIGDAAIPSTVLGPIIVTKPSYGFVLVKYQTYDMIPYLVDKLNFSPTLCGCSFSETCYTCTVIPYSQNVRSVLNAITSWTDWDNRYKMVQIGGTNYLFSNFAELVKNSSSYSTSNMQDFQLRRKLRVQSEAHQFIVDSLGDYSNSKSPYFPGGSHYVSGVKSLRSTTNWYEDRFASVVSSIYRSPPQGRFVDIWYAVRTYFGDYFPGVNIDYLNAGRELRMALWIWDFADSNIRKTLGESDVQWFKSLLKNN